MEYRRLITRVLINKEWISFLSQSHTWRYFSRNWNEKQLRNWVYLIPKTVECKKVCFSLRWIHHECNIPKPPQYTSWKIIQQEKFRHYIDLYFHKCVSRNKIVFVFSWNLDLGYISAQICNDGGCVNSCLHLSDSFLLL